LPKLVFFFVPLVTYSCSWRWRIVAEFI